MIQSNGSEIEGIVKMGCLVIFRVHQNQRAGARSNWTWDIHIDNWNCLNNKLQIIKMFMLSVSAFRKLSNDISLLKLG